MIEKKQVVFLFGLLFAIFVLFSPSISTNATILSEDLSSLSIEELISLQNMISQLLSEKGYEVYRDISHGDKGENVIKLQEKLKEYGYYNGNISGKYDSSTEKAVKLFQKNNNLDDSGIATQATQKLLYSEDAKAIVQITPKPTIVPKPTVDPQYANYELADYDDCARYPEKNKGKKVKIAGTVLQVLGTKETGFSIRLATSGTRNVFYISLEKGLVDFNILEDDSMTIYATMNGSFTYTSTMGKTITIPYATAEAVVLK